VLDEEEEAHDPIHSAEVVGLIRAKKNLVL
jgi:hypothetical protein